MDNIFGYLKVNSGGASNTNNLLIKGLVSILHFDNFEVISK